MTRTLGVGLIVLGVLGFGIWASVRSTPTRPPAEQVRGAALGLFASAPDYDYGPLIGEIAGRGARDLLLVVPLAQDGLRARQVSFPEPLRHSTVRSLDQARELGLRVALMPLIQLEDRSWRGRLDPGVGLEPWFESYGRALRALADIGQEGGAMRLGVGSELSALERYEGHWRRLIEALRSRFSGELFYAVNWDRLEAVGFWDALDVVGVSAYFSLSSELAPPSEQALDRAWDRHRAELAALSRTTNLPYLFSELGYPSHAGAARRPWDYAGAEPIDLRLQAHLWRAFCREFAEEPRFLGFYAWNWFGVGGPMDRTHTLRGKPAASVLEHCWAQGTGRSVAVQGDQFADDKNDLVEFKGSK